MRATNGTKSGIHASKLPGSMVPMIKPIEPNQQIRNRVGLLGQANFHLLEASQWILANKIKAGRNKIAAIVVKY